MQVALFRGRRRCVASTPVGPCRGVPWAGVEHGARASGTGRVLRARTRPGGRGVACGRSRERSRRWWRTGRCRGEPGRRVARGARVGRGMCAGPGCRALRACAVVARAAAACARGRWPVAGCGSRGRAGARQGGEARPSRAGQGGGVGPGCARQREREGKERKGKELGRRKRKRGKGEEGREKGGHAPAAIAGRAASGWRPRVGSAPGRKRRDSRRDRGARSATHGAWARVSATRGSREKQGAGYGCRDKSFGNQEIGTGRFPKSWG